MRELIGGRLARANVQAAINLARIRRDDLAVDAFGQFDGEGGFTDARWPDEGDERSLIR